MKAAELKELAFGLEPTISGMRTGDGHYGDGPALRLEARPLENLGCEARRQWAEALLGAFLRLQNSEDDPESSEPD